MSAPHPVLAELLDGLTAAGAVPWQGSGDAWPQLARDAQLDGLIAGFQLDEVQVVFQRGRPLVGGQRRYRMDALAVGGRRIVSWESVARPSVDAVRRLVAEALEARAAQAGASR